MTTNDPKRPFLPRGRKLVRLAAALVGILAALAAIPAGAQAEKIRVSIEEDARGVELRSESGLIVKGRPAGQPVVRMTVHPAALDGSPLRIRASRGAVSVGGRPYRGEIEVRKKKNGRLLVINELDLEDYLKGVVAAEVPSDWEDEALKAQAVASRTYALYQKRDRHRNIYHIVDTVAGQVYLGVRGERRRASRAVEQTRGEVVLYGGEPIAAFYHSSCGGRTEDAEVLWGIDEPYLKGVDCDCQRISTYGLWEKRFTVAAVLKMLRRQGYRIGRLDAVERGPITPGGRVQEVLFRSSQRETAVPSETIRAALGYSRVPSIFFEPELIDGEVVFSGRGLGHGVGLCQWGARELAQRGWNYREILQHYYPGTETGRIP